MIRAMRGIAVCAAVLLPWSLPAAQPIELERELAPDGRLEVRNVTGEIRVRPGTGNRLQLSGSLGEGVAELRVGGDRSHLTVEVVPMKNPRELAPTQLWLTVPATVSLILQSVSADVDVDGMQGPLEVETVSGDVALAAQSRSLELRTVSGNMQLRSPAEYSRINTVSGDVEAHGMSGRLTLETVSGNATLSGDAFDNVDIKSISGDVSASLSLTPQGRLAGESLSGNLRIDLPRETLAVMRLNSFSGDVHADFPVELAPSAVRGAEHMRVGQGAYLELASHSGTLQLRAR